METRRLEAFVILVDAGGFRQAAEELFITQPALSQQIARLELDVGVKLVDRSTRPISVTPAGREFYFRCRRVLDAMSEVETLLDDTRSARFGRVRVGTVPALLFGSPARAVGSFKKEHPGTDVTLRNVPTVQLLEEFEGGDLDICLLLSRPDLKGVSTLDLFEEQMLVCLPEDHPLAEFEEISFEQLKGERILQVPRSAFPEGFDAIVVACMKAGFSPRGQTTMGSFIDHAAMVSAGMGVSFIPSYMTGLKPDGVVYKRLAGPGVKLTATISWFDNRLDSVVEAFIRHHISQYPDLRTKQISMKGTS
jgi:DNA-binding transcriptional LysR family regulator